jgi:hypothetical protein
MSTSTNIFFKLIQSAQTLNTQTKKRTAMERKLERLFGCELGWKMIMYNIPISTTKKTQQNKKQMNSANYIQNLRDLQFIHFSKKPSKLLQPNKKIPGILRQRQSKTYLGR